MNYKHPGFIKHNLFTWLIIVGAIVAIIFSVLWLNRLEETNVERNNKALINDVSVFYTEKEISALIYDDQYIWMGGKDGIFLIDPITGKTIKDKATDIHMTYTASMCKTEDGSIWVAHEKGITIFKDEIRTDYSAPDILEGRANTIITDKDGSVWVGTQSGAIHFKMINGDWVIDSMLDEKTGLAEPTVNAIAVDGMEKLWFGSYLGNNSGGISILKDESWEYISIEEGLPHRYVTSILPLNNDYMLVGSGHLDRGGLALFERLKNKYVLHSTFTTEDGMPGEKIRHLYKDRNERLWITTESDGILICNNYLDLLNKEVNGIYLTTKNGLSDNEIKVIIETEDFYWLGGRVGLTRINKSTIDDLFIN